MSDAAELLREAQFAFHNIGIGSTSERRYRMQAKHFAKRILRSYPATMEAREAREILRRLLERYEAQEQPLAIRVREQQQERGLAEMRELMQRLVAIPPQLKRVLFFVSAAMFLFMPVLLIPVIGIIAFYVLNRGLLKKHLDQVLPDKHT